MNSKPDVIISALLLCLKNDIRIDIMKDIHKNPILYYIVVPVLIGIWPLLVWLVYLPETEKKWDKEKAQYEKAQKVIEKILTIDPERLDFSGSKAKSAKFDYTNAVDSIASQYRILATDYTISSRPVVTSGGRKSQSAKVIIKEIDIVRFAKFLSTIQLRWANLQCTQVKLTKKKGLADSWKVDLDFKYYF